MPLPSTDLLLPFFLGPEDAVIPPTMGVRNVIHYLGEPHVPQDARRRRMQVMQAMIRMGTPVLIKHMYNIEDVTAGVAEKSPTWDDVYGQERHSDPFSHGVGFVSVEKSDNEWINPINGQIVVSNTSPGSGYVQAPKYRGYGPSYLTFAILPDVAEDMFKLSEGGALIRIQTARAKMPWFPNVNDNDLLILCELDGNENVIATHERYKLKQTTQITHRGLNRRGRRYPNEPMDYGNQLSINQSFELVLIPSNDIVYQVETDR
jgi:hypothetical protein